jgi:DNA modification methylase
MTDKIIQGNVFDVLPTLAPGSVDCCVTSPPYWQLRSYLPKGHELKSLELGSEPTVAEYIANMVRVFSLVKTALADHATCWLNIGDTYLHDNRGAQSTGKYAMWYGAPDIGKRDRTTEGLEAGNMALIPQRLAIAMQDDGWIVRSVVVWHKPAPMPASMSGWQWRRCRFKVASGDRIGSGKQSANRLTAGLNERCAKKDSSSAQWADCPGCKKCTPNGGYVLRFGSWRPTSSWEPVLMLAKSSRYFCDSEAVKQAPAAATVSRDQYTRILDDPDEQFAVRHDHETICDGANPRDVWTIAAEPLAEKHYAAFPTELVKRCLLAGTSNKGYCAKCGWPFVRIIEGVDTGKTQKKGDNWDTGPGGHGNFHRNGRESGERDQAVIANKTVGWKPSCKCQSPERPGIVLDPFCGSGRTAIMAMRLGLNFVGCELNPAYVEMANRLIYEESPLFS